MRVSLKYKFTLALLGGISIVVLCMYLFGQWSFDRGFLRYVNSVETSRLDLLANTLEDVYAGQQNWDFLRDKPVIWLKILASTLPGKQTDPEFIERLGRRFKDGKFPPQHGLTAEKERLFEMRVVLLDASENLLFGLPRFVEQAEIRPLEVNSETIGYIGLAPQIHLSDIHQLEFVKRQKLAFVLIAAGMLAVAAMIAIPLADRLVRPIRQMTEAARGLAAGHFDIRTQRKSEDELGQLSRDFNALAATLEQNEKARRQWTADISHELRTPLAVLRGEIEALQDKVREVTPHALETLHGEVMHLNRLVNDLYELSLSDLGALTYKKTDVNLIDILHKATTAFSKRFTEKELRLNATFDETAEAWLLADPERLLQMFGNLLENSLRYTHSGGELRISLETNSGRITVIFEDTAPGVDAEDMPQLFERLFRTEFSRNRSTGGAGLGLSICRSIAEAHDGSLTAEASSLGGLLLKISMPINRRAQ